MDVGKGVKRNLMLAKRGFIRKRVDLRFLSVTGQSVRKTSHVVNFVLFVVLLCSGSAVSAKCSIAMFDVEGYSLPDALISLFLGEDHFSSGYEGVYASSSDKDGFFSLRIQYSAVDEGLFRRCRFPAEGVLIVKGENGPWRRYVIDFTPIRDPSVRKIVLSLDR